jgi:hypothetical protein
MKKSNFVLFIVMIWAATSALGQTVLYPDGDINTNWGVLGQSLPYLAIDDVIHNGPTDYIWTATASNSYECSLGDAPDPNSSGTHTITATLWANNGSANFTISLMQGGTTITTWVQSHNAGWTLYTHDLTTVEADAITDYDDLRLRIEHNASGVFKACSQLNLTIPPASAGYGNKVNGVSSVGAVKGVSDPAKVIGK